MSMENEILQRVTRMESRLVQLGDYVGANLRSKQRIEFLPGGVLTIDALDVSLSRIMAVIKAEGEAARTAIPVYFGDRLVMTVYPGS